MPGKRNIAVLFALACAGSWVLAQADVRPLPIRVEKELVYGKAGKVELKLDLAMPKDGAGPFPAVVCLHGGGWRTGKRQDMTKVIELLASRGFVAATVTYRLAPAHRFPAQIEDCQAAVRWLRRHAKKYRLDPERIGAVGISAGAHLACLLGVTGKESDSPGVSSRVQAVVSFFGPTDFTVKTWPKAIEDALLVPFLGGSFEEKAEAYRRCSPITYVTKAAPPFLFFHGDKDTLVGIEQSEKMVKKLTEAGVSARLVTMKGDGHGWRGEKLTRTLEQTLEFLREKLKK
jgi:acetyl esterase/lipase